MKQRLRRHEIARINASRARNRGACVEGHEFLRQGRSVFPTIERKVENPLGFQVGFADCRRLKSKI